ncbi:MAG TPA: AtpZ/AtpI family protein [Salinimicrobium sp.]|nr:AtpZ/AtpI family protein [Salinimicrobium sp.]
MKEEEEKKKNQHRYLQFINVAFQMGIIISAGVFIGIYLDEIQPNKFSAFTISCSLLGVFIALYLVIKKVQDMSKDD